MKNRTWWWLAIGLCAINIAMLFVKPSYPTYSAVWGWISCAIACDSLRRREPISK